MSEKWEMVADIDLSRRRALDWAKIYLVELLDNPPDDRLWSEYEWAYYMFGAKYYPDTKNFKDYDEGLEKFAEKEMRALEIRRDVFSGATLGESQILKEKYIETDWVRKRLVSF